MAELVDQYGRKIDYLRISIIDRCDFRCIYCRPEEGIKLIPRGEILSYEEIEAFSRAAVEAGISKIRITGGEPLIRRDVLGFIRNMAGISGLKDLSLTTNGLPLADYAQGLFDAGIKRINIGINSLDHEIFRRITRGGDLKRVLTGIKKALEVGFSPVKLNVVVLKGINDDLSPFVQFIYEYPVHVRFIEYMPITNHLDDKYYFSCSEMGKSLRKFGELVEVDSPLGFGPAKKYYKFRGALGTVSLICAVSNHFCPECNRLRLTADGRLRLCLFSDQEINVIPALRPEPDEARIAELIREGVKNKPKEYPLIGRDDNGRMMSQIGG
jgi:cyclic pyranopterin phosphate synthase